MCVDVTAFLRRIGYRGPCAVSLATLREVHRRHVSTVPFENLDVIAGRRLDYRVDRLFDKIVERRRGGWCLETNWLLAHVLRRMGFAVDLVGAGVATTAGFKHDLSHCLLVVGVAGERLLADVGFGAGSFTEPLPVSPGIYPRGGMTHRVTRDGRHVVVWRLLDDRWVPMYRVLRTPRAIADFAGTTDFNELSDDSMFNKRLTCARFTEFGWAVLAGDRLTVVSGGLRHEAPLPGPAQVAAIATWILHGGALSAPMPAVPGNR
jgi:N-hydroxyarylamine O-acetyltransferase